MRCELVAGRGEKTAHSGRTTQPGAACVMFAKGICKNGSSCYYLHGDGADQKFCELGRDCRRKGCRFVHTRT